MPNFLLQLRRDVPDRFLAGLALGLAFAVFLAADQFHWWQLRSDYAFGWLVPFLVVFVVVERWTKLVAILRAPGGSPMAPWIRAAVNTGAGLGFGSCLVIFLLGAVYRAGAGVSQPGSLALAVGFSGILLGLIYFNAPDGRVGDVQSGSIWSALAADARLRAASLFVLPACIWVLSAPLVTAVENAISLFLLRKVVAVVFAVFSFLGYPLIQEGSVLVLPHGRVGVADACSGIRSLTGCLFAGSFLGAVFLDRFWKKVVLVGTSMAFAFLTNLLRSLFLTTWAYAYGSDSIEGTLHDATGYAVLGLTSLALFCMLPLFRSTNWRRWLGLTEGPGDPAR